MTGIGGHDFVISGLLRTSSGYLATFAGATESAGCRVAYFEISAQVLLVPLLTLGLEGRLFRIQPPPNPYRDERIVHLQQLLLAVGTLALLIAGELAAWRLSPAMRCPEPAHTVRAAYYFATPPDVRFVCGI